MNNGRFDTFRTSAHSGIVALENPFETDEVPPHWTYYSKLVKKPVASWHRSEITLLNDSARRVYLARKAIGTVTN